MRFIIRLFRRRKHFVIFTCVALMVLLCAKNNFINTFTIVKFLQTEEHVKFSETRVKWTDGYLASLCKETNDLHINPYLAEDLLCWKTPNFLPNYKNPCWDNGAGKIKCLPYFHLLGADKCGSTDLFGRIMQHPQIEPPSCILEKECYYWSWARYGIWMKSSNRQERKAIRRYIENFKTATKSIVQQETDNYHSHITGEGTPMDFWDFRGWPRIPQNEKLDEPLILTPHMMRHVYPDPKFIVILREPTERLYSDYYFLGHGHSPEEFHWDAVVAIGMIKNCTNTRSTRQCLFDLDLYTKLPMRIHISCYSVFMREWLRVFPRRHFLVLRNEDYDHNIKKHMGDVFNFLNISTLAENDMNNIANTKRKHITKSKRKKGPMLKETRRLLMEFFQPFNADLANMLVDDRFMWRDKQ